MLFICQEEEESTWVPGKLKGEVGFELGLEGFKNENVGADASQELCKMKSPGTQFSTSQTLAFIRMLKTQIAGPHPQSL